MAQFDRDSKNSIHTLIYSFNSRLDFFYGRFECSHQVTEFSAGIRFEGILYCYEHEAL